MRPSPRTTPSGEPRSRRRATGADPLRKVSLRLHASVADAIRALVDAGEAPSADAFIEAAVVAELRERRRRTVYAAYEKAAANPLFVAEMGRITREFDGAVGDGLTADGT